jgi:hypothetical protein
MGLLLPEECRRFTISAEKGSCCMAACWRHSSFQLNLLRCMLRGLPARRARWQTSFLANVAILRISRIRQFVDSAVEDSLADFQFVAVGGSEIRDADHHRAPVVAELHGLNGERAFVDVFGAVAF